MKSWCNLLLISALLINLIIGSPLKSPVVQAAETNLIGNSSLEESQPDNTHPQEWLTSEWGTIEANFSYLQTGYQGNRSIRVEVTNYTSGDAKWFFTPISVTPDASYTFTNYYKSDTTTEVVARLTKQDNSFEYIHLGNVPASSDWKQASFTINTKADTKEVTIFHLLASVGFLDTDVFELKKAKLPDLCNGIRNCSVEESPDINTAHPLEWSQSKWGTNNATFSYPKNNGYQSSRSVRVNITNYTSGDAKWHFNPVSVNPGSIYHFSDYYKSNKPTQIVAQSIDAAGDSSYTFLGTVPQSTTWKKSSFNVVAPVGSTKMTILHLLSSTGSLQIDNVGFQPVAQATIIDHVPNNSLEQDFDTTPLEWKGSSWGVNTPAYEYLESGHTGSRSVKVTLTNYQSGDAKWLYTSQPLTPGSHYRFTDYYQSNVTTNVVVMSLNAAGNASYFELPNAPSSADWNSYSAIFTVPYDSTSVSILHFISQNGYLTTDDYRIMSYAPVGLNRPLVTITFDDGLEENITTAIPRLNNYGFKSSYFFATQHLEGEENAFAANLVKKIYNEGHEIGSHSVTHPDLTTLTEAQLEHELSHAKQLLESLVGPVIKNFATPFGAYNAQVVDRIAHYYRSHRSVDPGYNREDNFNINNVRVQNMLVTTTKAEIEGWLRQAKQDNAWLVLVYHRVSNNEPGPYDTRIVNFEEQLEAINQSGITVARYDDALNEILPQLTD